MTPEQEELDSERRRKFECKVCGNRPDEEGVLTHGKGCYTQSEDGGGDEYIPESVGEGKE